MMNYILYKEDEEIGGIYVIAEVFNNNDDEMLIVQKSLIEQGYVIIETFEKFIKCRKQQ